MSQSEPNIRIPVDLTNPGQFFACCGLLELAARVRSNTLAHFDDGYFLIHADIQRVLEVFFKCDVDVNTSATFENDAEADSDDKDDDVNSRRGRIYPMKIADPFNLLLDWWTDDDAQDQKLKTWTAGQRVTDLLLGHHKKTKRKGKTHLVYIPSMREHFEKAVHRYPNDWLRVALPIEAPMTFSYDSRIARNNALDLGHTNAEVLAFSPAVDVLALIGFQRFRPRMVTRWSRNLFCTWNKPLPVEVAAVASLGLVPQLIDNCFEFPIIRRDSQGRFKLFGHAQPGRSPHV